MIETEYRPKRTQNRHEPLPDGTCRCGCGGRPTHGGFLRGHWTKTPEGRAQASRLLGWQPRPRGSESPNYKGSAAERLAAKLSPPNENGCREWVGPVSRTGYATINDDQGRACAIHRLAFRLAYGEDALSDDLEIHHVCLNRACCEPSHLIAVSHGDHMRIHTQLRQKTPEQRMQGECRSGHSRAEYGFIWPSGRLGCRVCEQEVNRRRREERRAARAEAQSSPSLLRPEAEAA